MGATLLANRNTKLAPFFNPTGVFWLPRMVNKESLFHKNRTSSPERRLSSMDMSKLRRIWKGDAGDPGQTRRLLKPFVTVGQVTSPGFLARTVEE